MRQRQTSTNRPRRRSLNAKDHSQAVTTLQGLVDKGVPVDHAYRVVEASINQGMKGKDLAEVAKSIEAAGPAARKDAAIGGSGRDTAQVHRAGNRPDDEHLRQDRGSRRPG